VAEALFIFLLFLLAMRRVPHEVIKTNGPLIPPDNTHSSSRVHYLMVNRIRAVLAVALVLAFLLPVIVVAAIAVHKVNNKDKYPGLDAKLGTGYWM
jgi:hypothetical protein